MAVKNIFLIISSLFIFHNSYAGLTDLFHSTQKNEVITDDNWNQLTPEQQQSLLARYPKHQKQLQQRMDWFTQLPEDEQQKMRDVWQNMNTKSRQEMRIRMQKAKTKKQRDEVRKYYMEKFNDTHQ